jgi:REP-associated tyrosine transposase
MANTYTQIYIQVVFAVQDRQCLIQREHKEEIHKYITGIVSNQGQKMLQINGVAEAVSRSTALRKASPAVSRSTALRKASPVLERIAIAWVGQFGKLSHHHWAIATVNPYTQLISALIAQRRQGG